MGLEDIDFHLIRKN